MIVLQIANTDVKSDVDIYEGQRGKLYGRIEKYIIGTDRKTVRKTDRLTLKIRY